jgi:hypothetical protein
MIDIASLHVETVTIHKFSVMQNDFNGLSRVHHDGKVYLYDTKGVCIDDFKNFVLTAFYYDGLDEDDVSFMSYSKGFFWADVP